MLVVDRHVRLSLKLDRNESLYHYGPRAEVDEVRRNHQSPGRWRHRNEIHRSLAATHMH